MYALLVVLSCFSWRVRSWVRRCLLWGGCAVRWDDCRKFYSTFYIIKIIEIIKAKNPVLIYKLIFSFFYLSLLSSHLFYWSHFLFAPGYRPASAVWNHFWLLRVSLTLYWVFWYDFCFYVWILWDACLWDVALTVVFQRNRIGRGLQEHYRKAKVYHLRDRKYRNSRPLRTICRYKLHWNIDLHFNWQNLHFRPWMTGPRRWVKFLV